jgi:hypothetical protein
MSMAVFMIILANPIKFQLLINNSLRLFYAISIFFGCHTRMLLKCVGERGNGIKAKFIGNFRKDVVLPY